MAPAPAGPRFSRYLSGLPSGLDSHPECKAKGSVFRNLLDGVPCDIAGLPGPLRRHMEEPPIASEWLPEAHLWGLAFAVADQGGMDDDRLHAWARERNRKLFEGPVYRTLMALVPPGTLFRFSANRWSAFHRGSSLEAGRVDDEGGRATLSFPAGLFDEQVLRFLSVVFRTALEASRARDPEVELLEATPTAGHFRVRWS
jgi:hypothetical protein